MNQSTNQSTNQTEETEESVDLLICHATICTMDASRRVIRNGVVAVNNGMIVQIAEGAVPSGRHRGRRHPRVPRILPETHGRHHLAADPGDQRCIRHGVHDLDFKRRENGERHRDGRPGYTDTRRFGDERREHHDPAGFGDSHGTAVHPVFPVVRHRGRGNGRDCLAAVAPEDAGKRGSAGAGN